MTTMTRFKRIPETEPAAVPRISCELVVLFDQSGLIGFKMLRTGCLGHRAQDPG
jgi:hypothetical protein